MCLGPLFAESLKASNTLRGAGLLTAVNSKTLSQQRGCSMCNVKHSISRLSHSYHTPSDVHYDVKGQIQDLEKEGAYGVPTPRILF